MVYLVIKELSTIAEDVIMVTSSLMKDMQPTSEVMYRANAIRVLRKITDVSRPHPHQPLRQAARHTSDRSVVLTRDPIPMF